MNSRFKWGWSLGVLCGALTCGAGMAAAQDAVLYEVSENVGMKDSGQGMVFQSSSATLLGRLNSGTPLCPAWLAKASGSASCNLSINATANADDTTGIGPVRGSIRVVVQDWNQVDAPELVVVKASFSGTIDFSAAAHGTPIGSITGTYSNAFGVRGTVGEPLRNESGQFSGVFRLPFLYGAGNVVSYWTTEGVVPVRSDELTLGTPSVRLEVTLSPASTSGKRK